MHRPVLGVPVRGARLWDLLSVLHPEALLVDAVHAGQVALQRENVAFHWKHGVLGGGDDRLCEGGMDPSDPSGKLDQFGDFGRQRSLHFFSTFHRRQLESLLFCIFLFYFLTVKQPKVQVSLTLDIYLCQ